MKRNDWYVGAIVIVIALLWWGILQFAGTESGTEITVTREGTIVGVYSLSQEDTISFRNEKGDINTVKIHDGKAVMLEADCPDGLCMKQREISRKGESIICLPHKLVVEVTKGTESEVDAIVQ